MTSAKLTNRTIVLHPFFFAALIVLQSLVRTIHNVFLDEALRPLIFMVLLAGVLLFTLNRLLKNIYQAGLYTSEIILLLYIFLYSQKLPRFIHLGSLDIHRYSLILIGWALVIAFQMIPWIRKRIPYQGINQYLNLLSALYLLLPIYRIGIYEYNSRLDPLYNWERPENSAAGSNLLDAVEKPDIYYIILDGYASQPVLENVHHFDNSQFIEFLTSKGFFVAGQSRANYIQTALSVSSSLNFEYLDYFQDSPSSNRLAPRQIILDSQAKARLKELGYSTVAVSSEYIFTDMENADQYLDYKFSPFSDFEGFLLQTAFADLLQEESLIPLPGWSYDTHREQILFTFEQLANLPANETPEFIFAHIIAPHPPFVFDQNGNPVEPDREYTLSDGSHYGGDKEEYIQGYIDQLIFVNRMVEQMVTSILENSSSPPIIILQGDHGSGVYLDHESGDETCLYERAGILNAYHFPNAPLNQLYETISPVNSFRVLFNTYFSGRYPLLEDRTFYSTWTKPYQFIEATNQAIQPCMVED